MLDALARIGKSGFYWLALALTGLASEAVALFYQHALDEMPCVLCIQVRLWVMALIIVALLVLLLLATGPTAAASFGCGKKLVVTGYL